MAISASSKILASDITTMTGASADAAGTAGFVPAPAKGKQTSFLRGDGTWVVPTNTTYSAGTGLSLSSTTFSLATSGVTAGSYGPSANATPSHGTTFNVPYVTVDTYGRVTACSTKTVKIPAAPTSISTATQTTTVPNFAVAVANDNKCSGGSVSSGKWTLPSGGTWRYIRLYGVGTSNGAGSCDTIAGGSTLNLSYSEGGSNGNDYTYNYIAIRIS